MFPLTVVSYSCIARLKLYPVGLPVFTHIRWRKPFKRKPRWLPMAPTKVFRIPKHPYVSPEEAQLNEDLLEEYYRKVESLRKLFQDEIKQRNAEKDISVFQQKQEEEFRLLLEENKRENERIKKIREETLERELQEKHLEWLQLAEEKKKEMEKSKLLADEIIKEEKRKEALYITLENIDQKIQEAIDSPVNLNFTISRDGTIKWEGKPSLEYEADIAKRVAKGKESY